MISIIIPTYKRPESLKKAIKSVVNQTYINFELIVVNDSSNDNITPQIIKNFNDNRIKYLLNQRNKGANGARNTGILHSTGRYITFLDDDDEYLINRLEELLKYSKINNSPCIVSGYYYKHQGILRKIPLYKHPISLENFLCEKITIGSGSNIFIDKTQVKTSEILWDEDLLRHQDIELLIRLLSKYKFSKAPNRSLIVNGHNGFPDIHKIETAKFQMFKKIEPYICLTSKKYTNHFFAMQFRELALLYGYNKSYMKMIKFLRQSLQHKLLTPEKYIRFALILLDSITMGKTSSLWIKWRYSIHSEERNLKIQ